MDIKELLSNIDNSVLTEESKTQIQEVFEQVVSERVESAMQERMPLEIEASLQEQDESHSTQLSKLLEAIDKDHSEKLKKIVSRVDEDHAKKLEDVVSHYENALSEEAKTLTESLRMDVSNFLDLEIDKLLPKDMLAEAVTNTKAVSKLKKIQELVSIDEDFINQHIREALEDGRAQIEALRSDLNTALKENVRVSTEKNKFSSELVLERKTQSLPEEKKLFLEQTFKGKSPSYISENFDYALKMCERREKEVIKEEKAQVLEESVAKTIDTPKEESIVSPQVDPHMSEYVSGLE